VPVAEVCMLKKMVMIADKIVCPIQPSAFQAVGVYYDDFTQTTDEEVHTLLAESAKE
jgi:putative phosphoribosyl transferase